MCSIFSIKQSLIFRPLDPLNFEFLFTVIKVVNRQDNAKSAEQCILPRDLWTLNNKVAIQFQVVQRAIESAMPVSTR